MRLLGRPIPPTLRIVVLTGLLAGCASPARPRDALVVCNRATEGDGEPFACDQAALDVSPATDRQASFERFTYVEELLLARTVEVIEVASDGSLAVTSGHGPAVARPYVLTEHDRLVAAQVLGDPALVRFLRGEERPCEGHVYDASETMAIVVDGERFEQSTIACSEGPVARARQVMKTLARHYVDERP